MEKAKPIVWKFADTCRVLGISRSTGERLSRAPGLFPPSLRIGARRFHRRDEVMAWLAARAKDTVSES